jgi:site-specific recombinase XerD
LFHRYELSRLAQGHSPRSVAYTKSVVGYFGNFLGGIADVRKVTGDDLRRYMVYLRERTKWLGHPQAYKMKLSETTIIDYVRTIKTFWVWLESEGIIETNPLAGIRTPRPPELLPRNMTEEQMRAVFRVVAKKPREKALLLVLLDSGITLSEVETLDDADMDTRNGTIKVFRQKTRKERMVYISPETTSAVEAYRFCRPEPVAEPRLFLTEDGRPLTGQRIQKILERTGEAAGISQRLSPHKLRHSFATMSLKYGSNLEYVRLMLGHSDIITTSKFYLHVANADLAEAFQNTSPAMNIGLPGTRQKGHRFRNRTNRGEQYDPDPRDGIQPISYAKDKKVKKKKPRNHR